VFYSDKIAVFATIPVTVDFIVSGLVENSAVVHLQFLFKESEDGRGSSFSGIIWVITEVEDRFSFWVEYSSGHTFYSDCGLHNGGWGSVHRGESHQWGSGEGGVLFPLRLFWVGGIGEQDMVERGHCFLTSYHNVYSHILVPNHLRQCLALLSLV